MIHNLYSLPTTQDARRRTHYALRNPLIIIFFLIAGPVSAQVTSRTTNIQLTKVGTVNVAGISNQFLPGVQSLNIPEPGREAEEAELAILKQQVSGKYSGNNFHPTKSLLRGIPASEPTVINSSIGNSSGGDPNDNYVAISNGGMLVSVVNSDLNIYNAAKDSLLKTISLTNFEAGDVLYDPRIYYDPVADRFILVFLSGEISTSSVIIIPFSQTNNPTGKWDTYTFNGDPYNNETFSNFPSIASTQTEFFITVNMVEDNVGWQTGFDGTVIYQINKEGGYNGATTLKAEKHDSIYFNKVLVRDLTPVKGGSTSHGPNMYFLTTKTIAVTNDSVFLVEVTDTIGAPGQKLTVQALITPTEYGLAPNARQSNNVPLGTNDSRVLGGFFENGTIQYVQNAVNPATGFAAILHGVISNVATSPSITTHIIGDSIRDFGYPNISYAGNSAADNSAIINFNHTAPTVYAGLSVVYYDGYGNYSDVLTVQNGKGPVDVAYPYYANPERWGDYSGSQRVYNDPGKVWITGYYGLGDGNGTWMAEIGAPASTGVATINNAVTPANLYPNPAAETFSLTFSLPETQTVVFSIYDMKGSVVKQLLTATCAEGENIFHFSTTPLAAGVYILKAQGSKGAAIVEKVVKN